MDINLTTPLNQMGYGVAGLNIYRSLVKLGHNVALFPIGNVDVDSQHHAVISAGLDKARSFNWNAPSVRIWHQFEMAQHVGRGKRVGYTFFELDRLSPQDIHHLSSLDDVFVPCDWALKVLNNHDELEGVNQNVVPLGVDRSIFKPPFYRSPSTTTTFLTVGKWEVRKGHDVLIECFDKAFGEHDNVELLLLTHNPFLVGQNEKFKTEWVRKCRQAKLASKIHIMNRVSNHQTVAQIMQEASCGVFLSRGEAWNLELLEMMSCGKPVIATNCTGHSHYCNTLNSMLVETYGTEPAHDGIWFHGQGDWAKITEHTKDQIINHMRQIHTDNIEGRDLVNPTGIETAKQFTWENAAKKLVAALDY